MESGWASAILMPMVIRKNKHMKEKHIIGLLGVGVLILGLALGLSVYKQDKKPEQDSVSATEENLPEVEETKIVSLRDSDTFEMKAEVVKQEVGNRTIRRLAYNRQIPGPIIEAQKGSTVTLKFTNETEMPTTVHSHGLRLDNRFDGVPDSMHGSQKEIAPGESFSYTITFPDTGVFWYHPHMREDYQQEMGLYGNYLVQEDGYWNRADRESFLVFDDFSENDPFYKDTVNKTLMGRYGNLLLINNQEEYQLEAKQNTVQRLYLTNTANARPFLVSFPGARVKLVGGDVGRIEKEKFVDSIILAPAERAVVEVMYQDRGEFSILNKGQKIGSVKVEAGDKTADPSFDVLRNNATDYKDIRSALSTWMAKVPDKKLRATIEMQGMGGMRGGMMHHSSGVDLNNPESGIEWEDSMEMMNRLSTDKNVTWKLIDEATGKANDDISGSWSFRRGDLVKVEIYNDPTSAHPMQHPIHFHGQRFVVLSRNGFANDDLQWKDTALVRPGEKIELLIDMSNPGMWLAHCHIAEHMHAGMMFAFEVRE